ncbi:probable cytokinin riboside 5 -monophosphate phosphoribohydrolase LOG4 [Paramuricea clavata]|uniref:Probable cytokinin riboside 5 -monophosphate phosphoribohydrolase LOG4 n=1 Tax=Paramuricea clavata TaxID=317549 RepID=A0A6S7ILJ1_PARCT|nr:probable cytokinin riboside 5 -monophosphate phosphoribohydrolase LOG4 [Paramuricea clavata]CAB4018589.1 probable cytokinin riboside 5 -monophosphate phosphoribohydrolase LOG4 [Paramuricea clavata]
MCSTADKPALHTVVVYCGSSLGNNEAFVKAAQELGKSLLKRNISLIYGGGSWGIMGVIAKTVHEGGGNVQGIVPKFFLERDPESTLIGDTITVEDMHARKKMFCEKADAFIALPGGIGTLEEIVEMICWARLKLHTKPVGILNTLNYYGGILEWYQNALKVGFLNPCDANLFEVSDNCEQLIDALESRLTVLANST